MGNLSFCDEDGGWIGTGWLVIPFEWPVQVAARPIVGLLPDLPRFRSGMPVIPGCVARRRPGIHPPDRGYGFRARDFVAPRNDGSAWPYVSTSPVLDPLAAESFRPCGSAR